MLICGEEAIRRGHRCGKRAGSTGSKPSAGPRRFVRRHISRVCSLWLVLTSIGVWVWVHVFHRAPPSKLIFDWYMAIGAAVIIPLGAFAPLAPMKGKDPEIMAADEFFKGPKGS